MPCPNAPTRYVRHSATGVQPILESRQMARPRQVRLAGTACRAPTVETPDKSVRALAEEFAFELPCGAIWI